MEKYQTVDQSWSPPPRHLCVNILPKSCTFWFLKSFHAANRSMEDITETAEDITLATFSPLDMIMRSPLQTDDVERLLRPLAATPVKWLHAKRSIDATPSLLEAEPEPAKA